LPYFYRGLIRCASCGCMVTPEKHKGLVYYHCTQYNGKHGAEWLREEILTEQIGTVFKKVQVPQDVVDQIVHSLKGVHQDKIQFRQEQVEKLNEEKEKYSKRVEKIYLDKLDESITEDEYTKFYEQFRSKIADIDTQLSMLQEAEDNYYMSAQYILELANRAFDLFKSSEVQEKRQLIKLVFQNLELNGRILTYEVVKPFDTLLAFADSTTKLRLEGSNLQPIG
jgi:site-specific DNA recombinase